MEKLHRRKPLYIGTIEQPQDGDVRVGLDLGKKSENLFIFTRCLRCGDFRWVLLYKDGILSDYCHSCASLNRYEYIQDMIATNKGTAESPVLGDIRQGKEIKKKTASTLSALYIWYACKNCGTEIWKQCNKEYEPKKTGHCNHCHKVKEKHRANWRGGRFCDKHGYIVVRISSENFFFSMAGRLNHQLFEHRLIMAESISRCLHSWERVHHKNGIKDDNRIENLELTHNGAHTLLHNKGYQDGYARGLIDGRDKQLQEIKQTMEELKVQNKLLQWKLTEGVL